MQLRLRASPDSGWNFTRHLNPGHRFLAAVVQQIFSSEILSINPSQQKLSQENSALKLTIFFDMGLINLPTLLKAIINSTNKYICSVIYISWQVIRQYKNTYKLI